MICLDRLLSTRDPSTGFFGQKYWEEHFRLLPSNEMLPQHCFADPDGFTEGESLRLLGLPRSEPVSESRSDRDQDQLDAERLVEGALAHACFKKMLSGLWRNRQETVAGRWDAEDGKNLDIKPGTWAEYLRWGSVFLEQRRKLSIVQAEVPLHEGGLRRRIYEVGVLEPIIPGKDSASE